MNRKLIPTLLIFLLGWHILLVGCFCSCPDDSDKYFSINDAVSIIAFSQDEKSGTNYKKQLSDTTIQWNNFIWEIHVDANKYISQCSKSIFQALYACKCEASPTPISKETVIEVSFFSKNPVTIDGVSIEAGGEITSLIAFRSYSSSSISYYDRFTIQVDDQFAGMENLPDDRFQFRLKNEVIGNLTLIMKMLVIDHEGNEGTIEIESESLKLT